MCESIVKIMCFLYLYATTASGQDTTEEENVIALPPDEESDEAEPKKLIPHPPHIFSRPRTPLPESGASSPLNNPETSEIFQEKNPFSESVNPFLEFGKSPFTESSLYTPEFKRSLSNFVEHDEVLAKKSIEPMLDIRDPNIDWGALYELKKFRNGSFSEWVYGVWNEASNQLLYVIKSLKNHPISKARRSSIENQIKSLSNESLKEIRRKAQLAIPEKVFEHFEKLKKDAAPIFETQTLFHVFLPVQLLRVPDEYGDLKYIEICEAAQGESLEDYVQNKSKDHPKDVEKILKIVGKRLALFHMKTGYIHGDLNLGNIFMKDGHGDITLSFIDTHTMTNIDELLGNRVIHEREEFRRELFLEDVRNLIELISRLSISMGGEPVLHEDLVRTYIDAFLLGYKEGYAEAVLEAKFEEMKNEIFSPAESAQEEA